MAGRAHLTDRTGGGINHVGPKRLDRVDHRQRRALGIERGQNVAQAGFGAKVQRRIGQPQPGCAHAHLRRRLFARNIEAFEPAPRKTRCDL